MDVYVKWIIVDNDGDKLGGYGIHYKDNKHNECFGTVHPPFKRETIVKFIFSRIKYNKKIDNIRIHLGININKIQPIIDNLEYDKLFTLVSTSKNNKNYKKTLSLAKRAVLIQLDENDKLIYYDKLNVKIVKNTNNIIKIKTGICNE